MTPTLSESDPLRTALCRRTGTTTDARLLAEFATVKAGDHILDLGMGCGTVAIHLAQRNPGVQIEGLEIQPDLAKQAQNAITWHALTERIRIHTGDVREPPTALSSTPFDHVVCNPPYYAAGQGRMPPDPTRAACRFELNGTLMDFIRCSSHHLRPQGWLHMVCRPERISELIVCFNSVGLGLCRMKMVHPAVHKEAILTLYGARKGAAANTVIEPPIILDE
ncbi:MAG: methyltransferase [Magnetococcales bacterium]|nr:methyltransferase [Magnetococcales bacterium]